RPVRHQTDQLLAAIPHEIGTLQAADTDEIRLLLRDGPAIAGIVRRDRAIGVLPDDEIALLGAQNMHGLGAVEAPTHAFRPLPDRLPDGRTVIGGHVDLEAEFAGE